MPQPNYLPQQPNEPEESIEETLGRYKTALETLHRILSYGENLRSIEAESINTFEKDLREIIEGLEYLRGKPDITTFVTSIDAIKEKLQFARNALYTSLDVLEVAKQGSLLEVIEAKKRFVYPSLTSCAQFLLEAIQQFRT